MKKQYEAPKADKMEFNYAETVVASNAHCDWFYTKTQGEEGCFDVQLKQWNEYGS